MIIMEEPTLNEKKIPLTAEIRKDGIYIPLFKLAKSTNLSPVEIAKKMIVDGPYLKIPFN